MKDERKKELELLCIQEIIEAGGCIHSAWKELRETDELEEDEGAYEYCSNYMDMDTTIETLIIKPRLERFKIELHQAIQNKLSSDYTDEEFFEERDKLLGNLIGTIPGNYNPPEDTVEYDEEYHVKMKEYAKDNPVPSSKFIEHFLTRLQDHWDEFGEPGGDSAEYKGWADAGDVDDGEDFVSDLDIWEWKDYYDQLENKE
jgi:hypothetical protein